MKLIKKILFTIGYDGSNFSGWQGQKDESILTAQGAFEKACSEFFKQSVKCVGASRTDKGVHARGQRATIVVDTSVPVERMPIALNCFLSDEVVVTAAEEVSSDFHCRYCAKKKTYEYKILNDLFRNPVLRNYTEFIKEELDILKMEEACKAFIGRQNFKSFCATGSSVKTTTRTIFDLGVTKTDNIITMRISGDGFLYNMIRIIAGTLIYVGLGKIKPEEIPYIIESRDRTKAGKTAGPQGLTLINIDYEI